MVAERALCSAVCSVVSACMNSLRRRDDSTSSSAGIGSLPLTSDPRGAGRSGRNDPVLEQYAAAALAQLDRPTHRTVALGGQPGGLADKGIIEDAIARNLEEQPDLGEGLRPIRLTITLRPNRHCAQRLLHFLEQRHRGYPGAGAQGGEQQVRRTHALIGAERRSLVRHRGMSLTVRE